MAIGLMLVLILHEMLVIAAELEHIEVIVIRSNIQGSPDIPPPSSTDKSIRIQMEPTP